MTEVSIEWDEIKVEVMDTDGPGLTQSASTTEQTLDVAITNKDNEKIDEDIQEVEGDSRKDNDENESQPVEK